MFAEADAFIASPGGFGTLDETLEITTWQQLVRKGEITRKMAIAVCQYA